MSRQQEQRVRRSIPDERGGRVLFMSHLLLNQNTRYLGGAVCPGGVADAVQPELRDGIGIIQMSCPEQQIWGGVLKRRFLWLTDHPRTTRWIGTLSTLVNACIRLRYWLIANRVIREVEDYTKSGFDVVGVIGVADSPSCGVTTTSDLGVALRAIGSCPSSGPTTGWINQSVVASSKIPGQGLFVQALSDNTHRRSISVHIGEVDLATTNPIR